MEKGASEEFDDNEDATMKRMYDEYFAQDGDDIVENLVEVDDGASSDSDAEGDVTDEEKKEAMERALGRRKVEEEEEEEVVENEEYISPLKKQLSSPEQTNSSSP